MAKADIDFEKELYGQKLELQLVDRIRDEKKFESVEDLKHRLTIDKNLAERIL